MPVLVSYYFFPIYLAYGAVSYPLFFGLSSIIGRNIYSLFRNTHPIFQAFVMWPLYFSATLGMFLLLLHGIKLIALLAMPTGITTKADLGIAYLLTLAGFIALGFYLRIIKHVKRIRKKRHTPEVQTSHYQGKFDP